MKRPIVLWVLIALFIILCGIWLWQDISYPHTIWKVIPIGEYALPHGDLGGKLEAIVEAVPVWQPDNPLWVDVIRRTAPVTLFVLLIVIAAIEIHYRERKEHASRREVLLRFFQRRGVGGKELDRKVKHHLEQIESIDRQRPTWL